MADRRFWGEADMHGRMARITRVVNDPKRSYRVLFCCDARHRSTRDLLYSSMILALG
jgi:hypothetical protein